jgi:hypothetical protein
MKDFLMNLFQKADYLLNHDLATRDRSAFSRITTLALFSASVFCVIYYFINRIG